MFAHGRHEAVKRVQPGDWLAYYSPRTVLKGGEEVRAFTAIGKIRRPRALRSRDGRGPRRLAARHRLREEGARGRRLSAPRRASFIKDRQHWGIFFHRSLFSVPRDDFALIAKAMGLDPNRPLSAVDRRAKEWPQLLSEARAGTD